MERPVVSLRWDEIADADVDHWEVKVGTGWMANRTVYRGRAPHCVVPCNMGTERFTVRARNRAGRFSGCGLRFEVATTLPAGWTEAAGDFPNDEVGLSWPGTLVNTTINSNGHLELATSKFTGTYETPALDAGAVRPWLWTLVLDFRQQDLGYVPGSVPGSSPAAMDRTGEGMEPTALQPGADLETPPGSTPGSASIKTGLGYPGVAGRHTLGLILARFSDDGVAWSDWAEFLPVFRFARYVQFRIDLRRRNLSYQLQVRGFYAHAIRPLIAADSAPGGGGGIPLDDVLAINVLLP